MIMTADTINRKSKPVKKEDPRKLKKEDDVKKAEPKRPSGIVEQLQKTTDNTIKTRSIEAASRTVGAALSNLLR